MKVLFIAVTLFFSTTFAENAPSANQTKGSNEKAAIASDEEELIIGDDEDIQKANKQESVVPDTTKKAVAPAVSGAQTAGSKVEEELKLDGEEESILEPVKQEIVVADTSSGNSLTSVDSVQVSDSTAVNQSTDSAGSSPNVRGGRGYTPPTETVFVKKKAEAQTVSSTGSINFARNMADYRSPKLAMLMSMIIPGSGQIYAAHHSWKAAIYGAVEVGMIATSAVLRSKGIEKEKNAHKFADQHYNLDKYQRYQSALKSHVDSATYGTIFYGDDSYFKNDANAKNEDYYGDIMGNDVPFVNGWDDVLPGFNENLELIDDQHYSPMSESPYLVYPTGGDSTKGFYGFSDNQKIYRSKISVSRGYFSQSGLVLALMLVNHLVSAIDAGLTAKVHNDLLLNKKSVWNHVGLEQICLSDGKNIVPGYALKVRF